MIKYSFERLFIMVSSNLHRIGVYYNSPFFLEIIAGLGIDVEAERDRLVLRRFLMGELMTPMAMPERSFVSRTICTPVTCSISGSIGSLTIDVDAELLAAIRDNGYEPEAIKDVTVESFISDDQLNFEICFKSLETDAEFLARKNRAEKFNAILAMKDDIYQQIYSHVDTNKNDTAIACV